MDKFDTQKTHFSQHLNVKIFPRVAHVFRCWVPFETAQNSLLARGIMQKGPNHAFKKEETTYIVMLSWTLRGLQCVSQHMNRPQHASADNHGSNLAMSLRSHSTCCSARRWPEGPQQLRSVTRLLLLCTEGRNLQLIAHWLFPERHIQSRSAWCKASHVRDRPASTDNATAASSVSACAPRAQQSHEQIFLQPPCRQASLPQSDTKLVSQGCFHQPSSN